LDLVQGLTVIKFLHVRRHVSVILPHGRTSWSLPLAEKLPKISRIFRRVIKSQFFHLLRNLRVVSGSDLLRLLRLIDALAKELFDSIMSVVSDERINISPEV
jgi:hypothetical protein